MCLQLCDISSLRTLLCFMTHDNAPTREARHTLWDNNHKRLYHSIVHIFLAMLHRLNYIILIFSIFNLVTNPISYIRDARLTGRLDQCLWLLGKRSCRSHVTLCYHTVLRLGLVIVQYWSYFIINIRLHQVRNDGRATLSKLCMRTWLPTRTL